MLIATASKDNTIIIWDATLGQNKHVLKGHYDEVFTVKFNLQDDKVISSSKDNSVRIWDVATGECLRIIKGQWSESDVNYAEF